MPGLTSNKASSSKSVLIDKAQELATAYKKRRQEINKIQQRAIDEVLDSVAQELEVDEESKLAAQDWLEDEASIFRFYRRSRFDEEACLGSITTSLRWRLRTDLAMLSLSSLHPLYTSPPSNLARPPLFWMNDKFQDRLGRPCGCITLRTLERPEEGGLDEIREYIVGCMEIARRRLVEMRRQAQTQEEDLGDSEGPLQLVIAFDLEASSMSNLELELLPFLLDLLRSHFPGMVAGVYVLHYGWVHAGMWGLAKRVLPASALAKIFFPKESELSEHFELDRLPASLGGQWDESMSAKTSKGMSRLGRPSLRLGAAGGSAPSSPSGSSSHSPVLSRKPGLSRTTSWESMADAYFSATGTPGQDGSRAITPRASIPSTPRRSTEEQNSFQMTAAASNKLRALSMTRGSGFAEERGRAGSISQRNEQTASDGSATTGLGLQRVRSLRDFRLENLSQDASSLLLGSDSDGEMEAKSQMAEETTPRDHRVVRHRPSRLSFLRRLAGSSTQQGDGEASRNQQSATDRSDSVDDDGYDTPVANAAPTPMRAPDPHNPPRFLSRRAKKANALPGHVSPYNKANPWWGYPAVLSASSDTEDDDSSTPLAGSFADLKGTPSRPTINGRRVDSSSFGSNSTVRTPSSRRLVGQAPGPSRFHITAGTANPWSPVVVQRRYRDLLRTLTYLFVLRILSFHRNVKSKIGRTITGVKDVVTLKSYRGGPDHPTDPTHPDGQDEDAEQREWQKKNADYRRLKRIGAINNGMVRQSSRAAVVHNPPQRTLKSFLQSGENWTVFLVVFLLVSVWARRRTRGKVMRVGGGVGESAKQLVAEVAVGRNGGMRSALRKRILG